MLGRITKETWESLDNIKLLCIRVNRNQGRLSRQSDMPIIVKMSKDNKTLTKRRGITLTMPPKEGRAGRLPKRLSTPLEKVREFHRGFI